MNSAITSYQAWRPYWRTFSWDHYKKTKTDGQYSSVELDQANLANDLSYRTSTKLFNFKLGAFQNKNTWVTIVLVETVHMQWYQASKNQFSASIYLKTILTYSDAKLR